MGQVGCLGSTRCAARRDGGTPRASRGGHNIVEKHSPAFRQQQGNVHLPAELPSTALAAGCSAGQRARRARRPARTTVSRPSGQQAGRLGRASLRVPTQPGSLSGGRGRSHRHGHALGQAGGELRRHVAAQHHKALLHAAPRQVGLQQRDAHLQRVACIPPMVGFCGFVWTAECGECVYGRGRGGGGKRGLPSRVRASKAHAAVLAAASQTDSCVACSSSRQPGTAAALPTRGAHARDAAPSQVQRPCAGREAAHLPAAGVRHHGDQARIRVGVLRSEGGRGAARSGAESSAAQQGQQLEGKYRARGQGA